jgi:hypothetical protein
MRKKRSAKELTSEVVEALDGKSVDTDKYNIELRFEKYLEHGVSPSRAEKTVISNIIRAEGLEAELL